MAAWPYSTAQWQRLRKRKLADRPLCEPCSMLGRVVVADTVDHKRSIASGGDPFPPLDGLMSMCAGCHARKTNALDNPHVNARRDGVAFVGVDVNGFPIDPAHPFFPRIGEGEG